MRRLAFAIALVTVLAAAVLLALNWPRAEASPDVTITVNNPGSGGQPDWSATVLPTPTPAPSAAPKPCRQCDTGLNTCDLQKGDILLSHDSGVLYAFENVLFNGYWTHAGIYNGIYNGHEWITESYGSQSCDQWWNLLWACLSDKPGVEVNRIEDSGFCKTTSDWAILRTKANGGKREAAVEYAKDQKGKRYNWFYPDKWTTSKFYCSQLVWRAYKEENIDLDSNLAAINTLKWWVGPWGTVDTAGVLAAVPPDDIYFDHDVTLVKQRPGKKRAVVRVLSPAHLYVTDPEGRHTGFDPNTGQVVEEIPGVFYSGPEAEPEFMSAEDLEGTWQIQVLGTAEGEYTLQAEAIDADNHQVAEVAGDTVEGSVATYEVTYPDGAGEPIVLAPAPSPTATPTATPWPGATRTVQWSPGWHNATWTGTSTPEEGFACAAGNYAAAYRLVSGGWERHFPDRPELSNMTDLGQYDAFLILITEEVTCDMPVADPLGTERTLDWGVGWQNDGWTGADGSAPEDVFDCAEDSYAAAYRLVGGGWERHFPGRPDVSNMGPLSKYDSFLILVTAPVSCSMSIAP